MDGVRRSLRWIGVSVPDADLPHVVDTLAPDCLVAFIDARHVEVRSSKQLVETAVHTAVGNDLQGRKRILSCPVREGAENLEHWKEVERNLLAGGLRRVLLVLQDAFSSLAAVTEGMFPQGEVQLYIVHMLRNATASEFRLRTCWHAVS